MEKVAILIPCYNEELTIEKVIKDFKKQLPKATIYVYDNNSKDNTALIAERAGGVVVFEHNQGKGNVVRSMFRDIDADIYVMVDGDDTYPADEVNKLIDGIKEGYDMVIGDRLSSTYYLENKRPFHNFGNNLVKWLLNVGFKTDIKDVMTGYRAFSKKFVKTISIMSPGFQIETELTITSLVYRYNVKNIPIQYRDRPEGSESKLNTFSDGLKVLMTLANMFKDYRPLWFFSILSMLLLVITVICGLVLTNKIVVYFFILIIALLLMLGIILDHQMNIDRKNHELYVLNWVKNNEK